MGPGLSTAHRKRTIVACGTPCPRTPQALDLLLYFIYPQGIYKGCIDRVFTRYLQGIYRMFELGAAARTEVGLRLLGGSGPLFPSPPHEKVTLNTLEVAEPPDADVATQV